MEQFNLYRVTSALASIAISHRILFCARVVALSEKSKYHSVFLYWMVLAFFRLVQECFPKHACMGTARIKYDKETEEEGLKTDVCTEKRKAGTKEKRSPTA